MFKVRQPGRSGFLKDKIMLLILVVLVVNTSLIAFGYYYAASRVAGGDSILFYKQELARDLSDYNQRLAKNLEVYDRALVRDAIAEYNYAVEVSAGSDELIQVIINQGRRVQEIIHDEASSRLRERVLMAVNNDAGVKETVEAKHLMIRVNGDHLNIIPDQFLEDGTVRHINQIFSPDRYHGNQNIDIEIEYGVGRLVVPQTFEDQMRAISEDLSSMQIRLYETRVRAGLDEMVGPGIILQVYDAENNLGSDSLVHDADIRDIVNELFCAGASGISVGNQRLTTTSAIRCAGPLILVNQNQIPTNPVLIQAVGDPDLLISGLGIITNQLERQRGLNFELSASGFIKLPAYVHKD